MGTGSPASERTAQDIERDWLRRRGRRRAKILVVSTVIVVVTLTVIAVPVIRISTSVPGKNPHGAERMRDLSELHQPVWAHAATGNAFDLVESIDGRPSAIRDGVRAHLERAIEDDPVLSGVLDPEQAYIDPMYARRSFSEDWSYGPGTPEYPHRDAIDALYQRFAIEYLDAFAESEVPVLLDGMARTGYARRDVPPGDLGAIVFDGLGEMRHIATVLAETVRYESARGDADGAVRAFERGLAASRVLAHQPALIERIVANAMASVLLDAVQDVVAEGSLGAGELRVMGAAMDRQLAFPPASFAIEGEWLMHEDYLIRTHSDDGRGSGYALPVEAEWRTQGTTAPVGGASPSVRNVPGLLALRKRERLERARAFFEAMIQQVDRPRPERDWSVARARDIPLDVPEFLGSGAGYFRVLEKYVHSMDAARAQFAGMRVLIAVEAYRADHGGDPPVSLDVMVPGYLDEMPADPLAPDGAFRYRVLDEPDELGRVYLLYSVGGDGIDDGGVGDPDDPVGLLSGRGSSYEGTDYVFNRPPDED
ncbi:MAG: hypothetical protein DHS20C14_19420 [Phycisphaeraceae bacterium]|nr:MAG: hypothetical protein DHS20C14_19420 [Phycisphaeraceae bacterium]